MDRTDVISLAGQWAFEMDREDVGIKEAWFGRHLKQRVHLPGSTDQGHYGTKNTYKDQHRLSRKYEYAGAAWYQKTITVPPEHADKRIILFLERAHWETRLWIDEREVGMQDSLCSPHRYDLTGLLAPGEHTATLRIDNTMKVQVGDYAHSVTRETQTNWNGAIGRIELQFLDRVYISDIQAYPDIHSKSVKLALSVENSAGAPMACTLLLTAKSFNGAAHEAPEKTVRFDVAEGLQMVEVSYKLGEGAQLWDEFSPTLYRLAARLEAHGAGRTYSHETHVDFGMREFKALGTQFAVNGRLTFLRGTLECCVFPQTGYPAMDVQAWLDILQRAKAYGLNHLRFHSWCPPEAAFAAADRMGFLLQVETPVWTVLGGIPEVDSFIHAEGDRILREYGNHPSFCMLSVGNEPSGDNQEAFLTDIVTYWKNKDPRRLYTGATGWPEIAASDYHAIQKRKGQVLRCQDWGAGLNSRLNAGPLDTSYDYRELIEDCAVPVVSHEIGQWCVYPDFKEIDEYQGVVEARNLRLARDSLLAKGMLDQAEAFLSASGKMQALLYKEDIEALLRTPGHAGFQLLGLTDFPGQGTALVGVLNALWESKGYITGEEFRRFCCETVPLARLKKMVWTSGETLKAEIAVAHFGAAPLENALIRWRLLGQAGTGVSGEFAPGTVQLGNSASYGELEVPLERFTTPSRLELVVSIDGTEYENRWNVWVYPERVELKTPENITLSTTLVDAYRALGEGKNVLLLPGLDAFKGNDIPAGFTTIFWNTEHTGNQPPHTLGILCDPKHPALQAFPTDFHSDWHWYDLVAHSKFLPLDETPTGYLPIVQIIDDWNHNRKLGLMLEARVGGGRLLLCSIDLLSNVDQRPVARQLLHSLYQYVQSPAFDPKDDLTLDMLESVFSRLEQR